MDKILIENPSYIFWRNLSSRIPYKFRQTIKNSPLPPILELLKWIIIDLQRIRIFHPYGLHFFTGLPGTGKTIFMSSVLEQYRRKFGDSIYIGTNYGYINQDFEVHSYKDILKIYDKPVIIGYDEIQNDFDARTWEKIDYAFSERITQSRKMNGMMILGTAQKFSFIDKRLRQLTSLVYECRMIGNRLTIAKIYEPEIKEKLEAGQFIDSTYARNRGIRMLIQTDWLRNTYDSYQILQNVASRLEAEATQPEKLLGQLKDYFNTGK